MSEGELALILAKIASPALIKNPLLLLMTFLNFFTPAGVFHARSIHPNAYGMEREQEGRREGKGKKSQPQLLINSLE